VPFSRSRETPPRARSGETVLVADDEELVRITATDVLEDLGYMVLSAKDGEQALGLFHETPNLTLALVDVVMPNLGGVDAVRQMRVQRPNLPVIFTTGYDRDSVLMDMEDWDSIMVLTKPYPMARIGWQVREMIDALNR